MTDRPDKLDDWLDRALASYTPAAPRAGLEKRTLARLAAGAHPSRHRPPLSFAWAWAAACALAAAVVLFAVLLRPHASQGRVDLAGVPNNPPQTGMVSAGPRRAETRHPLRQPPMRRAAARQRAPRLIPPRPTQQQMLIAQLLANGPEAVASLARAAERQEKPIEFQRLVADPLVIEPIKIPPIDDNPAEPGGTF